MDNGLEAKVDVIIRLLAAPLIQDKPIAESAPMLSKLGLDNNQIATICNTAPNVIRTALLRAGKPRAGRRSPRGKSR
jgi:hypothetical protein